MFLRIVLLFTVLPFFLHGKGLVDFSQCYRKNQQVFLTSKYPQLHCYQYSASMSICLSKKSDQLSLDRLKQDKSFIAYDRFLGIAFFRHKFKKEILDLKPLNTYSFKQAIAFITPTQLTPTALYKRGVGLDYLPEVKDNMPFGSIVGVKCYKALGIGVGKKQFIPEELIILAQQKQERYGDIGIRLDEQGKVFRRDIYFSKNPFRVGDEIIGIDNTPLGSAFERAIGILSLTPDTQHCIHYKRNGKPLKYCLKVEKRFGGGRLPDTFLERFGLLFNHDLSLKEPSQNSFAQKRRLHEGDRLLAIDGKSVKSYADIIEIISKKSIAFTRLLFERDDFQFFVEIVPK